MKLITLTQSLRDSIIENYYKYEEEIYSNYDDINETTEFNQYYDEFIDEENILNENINFDNEEIIEEKSYIYDEQIIQKITIDIKKSEYKRTIYFIILKDCLEYIKSKFLKRNFIYNSEKYLMILLENFSIKKLLNAADKDNEFLFDIINIFLEYNIIYDNKERYENRFMLKKEKADISKQFKLSMLDDVQYYYEKNK